MAKLSRKEVGDYKLMICSPLYFVMMYDINNRLVIYIYIPLG
jgi:hypothetical protein